MAEMKQEIVDDETVHNWSPVFVLPNVELRSSIESDITAMVPPHDPRVERLKIEHPPFEEFLSRFSDNFGAKFEPTVLLVRSDANRVFFDVSSLASFRDAIALSVITHNRALSLCQPRVHRTLFGEAFSIYPWMIDKNYENLIGNTPAMLGLNDLNEFQGQSSPTIFRFSSLDDIDIDRPLLTALLGRWRRRYESPNPNWVDIALFRSLNMAYHASLLPAAVETTFYDVGRLISLWVSAFEILVHPGGNGQANCERVFELIEKTHWDSKEVAALDYKIGRKKGRRSLASWIYETIYKCRNDFLHGNPVERDRLILPVSRRNVFEYAAPLYRIALTAFLPLTFDEPISETAGVEEMPKHIADRMTFIFPQRNVEDAILTAIRKPSNHRSR